MKIEGLCKAIQLNHNLATEVIAFYHSCDFESICKDLEWLKGGDVCDGTAIQFMYRTLAPDERQIKMLTYMLHRALEAYEEYKRLGISEEIYIATMKCFERFINEYYAKTGLYMFDRGWWTVRQISLQLFRIGELEYEMIYRNNQKEISIHIPSDSKLSEEKCIESIKLAKEFFNHFFPEYSKCEFICDSWLLSPALKKLLPDTSNIIKFQNIFDIIDTNPDSMEYMEWVFHKSVRNIPDSTGKVNKREDINFDELPDDTMLQRNIKSFIKSGGKIGQALGILNKFRHA